MSNEPVPLGYNTPIPTKIMTPDRVETRVRTLEFASLGADASSKLLILDELMDSNPFSTGDIELV